MCWGDRYQETRALWQRSIKHVSFTPETVKNWLWARESGCITNEYVPYLLIALLSVCLVSIERFPLLWSCASITQTKPGCGSGMTGPVEIWLKWSLRFFNKNQSMRVAVFLKIQYPPRNPFNQKALRVAHCGVYLLILVHLAEKSIS